jgi:flagellin
MSNGLSAAVRTNLVALQKIAADLHRAQMRLASGRKVNSPLENPAAFFTAAALTARAAALNTVVDKIGTGKKVLEAASAAIEGMQSVIATARGLAYEALNSASTLAKVTGSVTGLTGTTSLSGLGFDGGDTITVSDGITTATYTHAGGQDIQDFLDAVNNETGLKVEATLTVDGRIQLEATGVNNVTIGGSASAGELAALGLTAGPTTSTSNSLRQALAQQFDSLRTQFDLLAADAGFNGQNVLGGSTLSITLNESGSSTVTVAGSTVSATSLGIDSAVTTGGNFQYDADINSFIADLDVAEASLRQMATSYSAEIATVSIREDFSKEMANLFETGSANLISADMDLESALVLALQARRQLAVTSLMLAAEADKTALRLFATS